MRDFRVIPASPSDRFGPNLDRMTKLCILVGTTLGSYGGWALADSALGLGFGWAFVISGIGSIVGVYAGWKFARRFE